MCSDPVDSGGEVRSYSVGCTIGMWDMAPLVLIITADRYKGFLELKKMLFQAGCCGYGGISCFFHVGQAQPSVRVRSCRMWFHLMKVFFPDA